MLRTLFVLATLAAFTVGAAPVAEDDGPPVPLVLIAPPYPLLDDGSAPSGRLIVVFKLTPEARAPVEARLVESDLPDRFYEQTLAALSYWRFRPNGDPFGCISQVHRVALTVDFDPAYGSRIVSLVSNARPIPLEGAGRYVTAPEAIAAIERLESLLKPLEPIPIKYPFFERGSRATGYVAVRMQIDAQGRVSDPAIVATNMPEAFGKATLKGLRKARFEPVIEQGVATAVHACFVQHFTLTFVP